MRFFLFLLVAACSGSQNGRLYAKISSDAALAMPITTDDGWTVTFSHVVVSVSSFDVEGTGVNGLPGATTGGSKLIDFSQDTKADLASNMSAQPLTYDHVSVVVSRTGTDVNMNVPSDVLTRMGSRSLWLEGSATKQSTTRTFQLGLGSTVTFDSCMPFVELVPFGMATVDFRVHAQKLFADDTGKLRFDAWAAADAFPQDGTVETAEAAMVMTSSLPAAQYGSTSGTLVNVLEKRSLSIMGLGDSGTCSGH